jgi:hypothetical protein
LTDAYLINPVLNAERARLRATDEQVALAKCGLRPFISGSDTNFVKQHTDLSGRRGQSVLDLGELALEKGNERLRLRGSTSCLWRS